MDSIATTPGETTADFPDPTLQSHLDDSKLSNVLSPNGGSLSPCTRGKTMREFEAELSALKQENFELKMKIYVLEEQKDALEDQKDVAELRINYQTLLKELTSLKSDLAEKEDLIMKAGEAMGLLSKQHDEDLRRAKEKSAEEMITLREVITKLEQEVGELKERSMMVAQGGKPGMFDDSSAMYAMAFNLTGKPSQHQQDIIATWEVKVSNLEEELQRKCCEVDEIIDRSNQLNQEANQLRESERNLQQELQFRVDKLSAALSQLSTAEEEVEQLKCQLTRYEAGQIKQDTKLSSDLEHIQGAYTRCKDENKKLHDQVLKLHQRITELERYKSVEIHRKIDNLTKENGDLRHKIVQLKAAVASSGGGNNTSSGSSKETMEKINQETQRRKELEKELEETKKHLEAVKGEHNKTVRAMHAFLRQNKLRGVPDGGCSGGSGSEPKREDVCERCELSGGDQVKTENKSTIDEAVQVRLEGDGSETEDLHAALERKRKQVDQLNEKLRQRTQNLQELVNKELWSKNKEIEKLNRLFEQQTRDWTDQRLKLKSQEGEIKTLTEEIEDLRRELSNRKHFMEPASSLLNSSNLRSGDNEKNEKLKGEIRELKCRLEKEIEENYELTCRCQQLREEAEVSEKGRKELQNTCAIMTTRLEELCSFLESLLPSLCGRKRRLVEEAIDISREVSRSLSLSCLDDSSLSLLHSISSPPSSNKSIEPLLPDVSQVDFNSEEDLDDTLVQPSESVQSQSQEVLQLRSQMEILVKKLKETSPETRPTKPLSVWSLSPRLQERRDLNMSDCLNTMSEGDGPALEDVTEGTGIETFETTEPEEKDENKTKEEQEEGEEGGPKRRHHRVSGCGGSESEGWSEPDRTVSLARIGFKEDLKTPPKSVPLSESDEEPRKDTLQLLNSAGKKRRDSEIRSLHAKIRSLELIIEQLKSEKKEDNQNDKFIDVGISCQIGEGSLTQNILSEIRQQREILISSLTNNEAIKQKLEDVLAGVPASPNKTGSNTECGDDSSMFDRNLLAQVIRMTERLEESCDLCLDLETKCMEMEKEKISLLESLAGSETRAKDLGTEVNALRCVLKEKDNELLEKQCALLEIKNSTIILESRVRLTEEEVRAKTRLVESMSKEADNRWKDLSDQWDNERLELINKYEAEIANLKLQLKHLKIELAHSNEKLDKTREEKDFIEGELKARLDAFETEKTEYVDKEGRRRHELEDRLEMALRSQEELRIRLEEEKGKVSQLEIGQKLTDRGWRRRVAEVESTAAQTEARLRRKLDQLTLSNSEVVLERTRLANERLVVHRQHAQVKADLERRVHELESANTELEGRLAQLTKSDSEPSSPRGIPTYLRQRSNPTSDYTSDHDNHNNGWFPMCGRHNNSSSPDLGIESDNRLSSMEPLHSPKQNGETVAVVTSCLSGVCPSEKGMVRPVRGLEVENVELRAQLVRTRQALEETLAQLSTANQKKRQVERAICRQLHKTNDILQRARLNLEDKTQS